MSNAWSRLLVESFVSASQSRPRLSLATIAALIGLIAYVLDNRQRTKEVKREFKMHHRRNSGILQPDGSTW